ncbi:hypothetical protein FE257_003835 [Aspergillus nanangensis]|uniref:Zn(2)-C6 fungal-type domain-containing protein n=1 Tax=Aspergillus nanangensis TaxID=2582783 RepID=A0AAD4GND5_ASPNN|nr:hypothetical protein FE257_003835 [Aspergillus nanangensis]
MDQIPASTRRRRAKQACDRCRRQKLKCDSARPCLLCVHSGNKCETSERNTPSGVAKRRGHAKKPERARSFPESLPDYGPSGLLDPSDGACAVTDEQPSPNVSVIGFARQVFDEVEAGRSLTQGSVPGDTGKRRLDDIPWSFGKSKLPPDCVLWVAIDAYFSRVHWFMLIFHEIHFRNTAKRVLSLSSWKRRDLSEVLVVLTVVAVGLKAALPDVSWAGYEIFNDLDLDGCRFMISLVCEIRLHLLDLIEDCHIEAVQVCLLLSSMYGYHDSPSLAWNTAGMAFRAAMYLELYKRAPADQDPTMAQVRCRCWNTIMASDVVLSIIYGRPLTIDATFARLHVIHESEDMRIDSLLLGHPMFKGVGNQDSTASFHTAKFKLYVVIRKALVHSMNIRSTTPGETVLSRFESVAQTAHNSEALLRQWQNDIPALFDFSQLAPGGRWERLENSLQNIPLEIRHKAEVIILQAAMLQVIYDSALILVHQPLLEHKTHDLLPSASTIDSVDKSLRVAVEAALRISDFPVHMFQRHFAISFISLQLFTAGVILCLLPLNQPFTHAAQEAKTGVMKIIKACRAVKTNDRIAQHTVELLTELLKVTINREMNSALKTAGESREMNHIARSVPTRQEDRPGQGEPHDLSTDANPSINIQVQFFQPTTYIEEGLFVPGYPEISNNPEQGVLVNDPTGNNASLGSIFPALPQSGQTLQEFDDAFGQYGQSMFALVADDRYSAWNLGRTFP